MKFKITRGYLPHFLKVRLKIKNIVKKILKTLEIFKQYLMKKYKVTNEEMYCVKDDIYRERKLKNGH